MGQSQCEHLYTYQGMEFNVCVLCDAPWQREEAGMGNAVRECGAVENGVRCQVGFMGNAEEHETDEQGNVLHRHANYTWVDEKLDDEIGNLLPPGVSVVDLGDGAVLEGFGIESLGELLQRLSGAPAQDGERCETRHMVEDWEPFFNTDDIRRLFYAGQIVLHTSMAASAPDTAERAKYMDQTRQYMRLWIAGDSDERDVSIASLEATKALVETVRKVDALGHDMVEHGIKGVFLPPM